MEYQPIEAIGLAPDTSHKKPKKLGRIALVLGLSASAAASAVLANMSTSGSEAGRVQISVMSPNDSGPPFGRIEILDEQTRQHTNEVKLVKEMGRQYDNTVHLLRVEAVYQADEANKATAANYFHQTGHQSGLNGQAFLDCTQAHESINAGSYQAVSPDGVYRGAYQFLPSTWDNTAAHSGRPDLIGVSPDQASPADQDAMALDLHAWQGNAPWGGRC